MIMITFPKSLLDGYRTFRTQRLPTEQTRYRELSVSGQSPEVMVIGCCDSRVSPEVIFDAGPGELFVVRNVANLVPVYQPDENAHGVSAALEYAVNALRIRHVVVLGHAQCGGIRAFIDKTEPLSPGDFIGRWMAMFIKPGELFVMRNIANLVPVYEPDGGAHGVSAALEFAVQVLGVKHIVVLGHAQCGGIRAFIDKIAPLSPGDFIGRWMSMFVKPGEKVEQRDHESMADFTVRIEKAAVFRSLENLMTFPFVRTQVGRGELNLHGAYFGVAEGSLFVLDRDAKEFRSARDMLQSGE